MTLKILSLLQQNIIYLQSVNFPHFAAPFVKHRLQVEVDGFKWLLQPTPAIIIKVGVNSQFFTCK